MSQDVQNNNKLTFQRKQELNKMIKKPICIQTKVRIRFPDQYFIQAVFSPKETIQDVVNYLITAVLSSKPVTFYLYQTPPVVKITTEKNMGKTLEQMKFVLIGNIENIGNIGNRNKVNRKKFFFLKQTKIKSENGIILKNEIKLIQI